MRSASSEIGRGRGIEELALYDLNLRDAIEPGLGPTGPSLQGVHGQSAQAGEIARLILGFIPIVGDAVDGLEQLYNAATGRKVDPVLAALAAAGLALDVSTGGAGDVTAGVKAAYRVSLAIARQGGGLVATAIRARFVQFASGRLSPRALVDTLQQRFGKMVELGRAPGCGGFGLNNICLRGYDKISAKILGTRPPTEVLQRLDGFLDEARSRGVPPREHLNTLAQFGPCFGARNRGIVSLSTADFNQAQCDLLEVLRWRMLAFDPDPNTGGRSGKWKAGEANSALRYEQQYGVRLERYSDTDPSFDFKHGTITIDVKGAVNPQDAAGFQRNFSLSGFTQSILRELQESTSDFVIVETLYIPEPEVGFRSLHKWTTN